VGSEADARNLDFGKTLTMTVLALVALATTELEDDELLVLALTEDFRLNLCPSYERRPKTRFIALDGQYLAERYLISRVPGDTRNTQLIAFCGAELLAASFKDCMCHGEGGGFSRKVPWMQEL
jgi:hypothetical protein